MLQLKKAQRSRAKLKIGISGPSGSGKTYSALLLAKGLVNDWDKIAVIDTENGSANLYDHLGDYNTVELNAPYTPEIFIEAIKLCIKAGKQCIVIDSATAEWSGEGGCLDIHAKYGGKFTDWAKVTPRHKSFIDSWLHADAHVIVCSRTKTEWQVDKNDKGKVAPTKVGLATEQRQGLEYEYTVAFRLNIAHLAFVEKDRTGFMMDKPEELISEHTGKRLLDWSMSATGVETVLEPVTIEVKAEDAWTPQQKAVAFGFFQEAKVEGVEMKKMAATFQKYGIPTEQEPFLKAIAEFRDGNFSQHIQG